MDYTLKKNDYYYLILLFLVNIGLLAYYINFNINFGIFCSDVYLYLVNALYFAGETINVSKYISLTPVLAYLTSLLFRLGITNQIAIFIVSGLFAIIGNIGFFLLLKVKFNNILSFLGSVLFMSFSLNLAWFANGSIDIPSVALTIWAMFFLILGVNKNPKFLTLALITFTISFFVRPTVILFLPVAVFYYFSKRDLLSHLKDKNFDYKKEEYKYILLGIIISAIIFIFISIKVTMGDNLSFIHQSGTAIAGLQQGFNDNAYNPNVFFYLENFPNFLSSANVLFIDKKLFLANPTIFAYFLIGLLGIGLGIFLSKSLSILKTSKIKKHKLQIAILSIMIIISILSFNNISSVLTIILTFFTLLIADDLFKKLGFKNLTLPLTFLAWILFPLIFQSYYDIKVDRYIIPSLIGITFFIISSLYLIQSKFQKEKLFNGIYLILIVFLLCSSFTFVNNFEDTNEFKNQELIADFLIEYDPDYKDKSIGAYNIRPYTWFFSKNILAIPSSEPYKLDTNNVTYYISNIELDLDNYDLIKSNDHFYLYERVD